MISEVIFDVETKNLFSDIGSDDPGKLGVSIVSVYSREIDDNLNEIHGKMETFFEKDFTRMFELFKTTRRLVGFNTLKFDIPALQPYTDLNLAKLPHLDIMAIVRQNLGFSLSLNSLATTTLNMNKTDSGVNAVIYWRNGDPENLSKLVRYCEADVDITTKLYDFGLKNNLLKYKDKWNNLKDLPIDFSYPKEVIDSSRQMGMF